MDIVGPVWPVGPIWPTPGPGHEGFPPGTLGNRTLPDWSSALQKHVVAAPDPEAEPFVPPERPVKTIPVAAKDLRHVLLDAGVHGLGPVGAGFELPAAELTSEMQHAYRHIANSLMDVLPAHHELPMAILAALATDPRAEREMGLLVELNAQLAPFLGFSVNIGVINRWHKLGTALREQIAQHPLGIIGDLHLVESPTHRWHP